ncbi:MAG: glycosyltransferase family 4 protein, partial [Marinobacter sp.]
MNAQGPLTIALIIATPGTGWGGMETHTADLANALSTRGHTVHVLAHSHYSERFASPVCFHPLPVQLGRRNPWLHYRLRRLLRSIHPDIVHAQG